MSDQPTQHDDAGTTPEVGGHEVEASPPPAPEPEPQAPVSVPVRGRGGDEPRARKSEREDSVSRVVEVVDSGLRTLYRSQLPRMAAALAYRTLFSIIPIFFIALLFLRGFATPAVLEDGLTRILQFTGADQITVDPSGGLVPPPPKPGEPAAHSTAPTASPEPMHESDEDADDPENEGPILEADAGDGDSATTAEAEEVRRQAVSDIVSVLVDRVSTAVNTPSSIWVGFASGIVLIYAALSMLIELEKAFNQIYRAPAGRRFGQRLLLYTFILTYGTLLLVASFYLAESVTGFLTGNENTHFLVGLAG